MSQNSEYSFMDEQTVHILVIDDSPVNQKILQRVCEKEGYSVTTVDDGASALKLLEEFIPDLILLDIIMPDMDGFDVCRHIKSLPTTMPIPVIFISSLRHTRDKISAFKAGAVDYITKPFHPQEVLARIKTHLHLCYLQKRLKLQNLQLEQEKHRSERLLLNVLPARVAQELMETGEFRPQLHENVTVCFIDIVNFTQAVSRLQPEMVIKELNEIFSAFDAITEKYHCERMKTIGDAYLCASGIPDEDPDHIINMAKAALEMINFLYYRNHRKALEWEIRVGLHSGTVVGGIVGTKKYLYDIFGDTVNIASRLEKHSQPMRVNVSDSSYQELKDIFSFLPPKTIAMKGKGEQITHMIDHQPGDPV